VTGQLFQTGYVVCVGRGTDPAATGERMTLYTTWDRIVDGVSAIVLFTGFYVYYCVSAHLDLILAGS